MSSVYDLARAEGTIQMALERLNEVDSDSSLIEMYAAIAHARNVLGARRGNRELTMQDSFPCISYSGEDIAYILNESDWRLKDGYSFIDAAETVALDLTFDYWRDGAITLLDVKGFIEPVDDEEEEEDEDDE